MQIVDLSIDLPAASLLPHILPSISLLSWRYHPSSYSYQFISPHASFLISPPRHSSTPLQPYSPVKMITAAGCVCLCVCTCVSVRGKISVWPMVRGKTVCIINYSLETGKRQIVKVNECVCVCLHALSSVYQHFCFSVSQAVCLFKYLFLSLCLSLRPICCLRATTVVKSSRQTS